MCRSVLFLSFWAQFILCFSRDITCIISDDAMKQMLDGMQQMMTGEDFDGVLYQDIRKCMRDTDSQLTTSQDAAWGGIIQYWIDNGNTSIWGEKQERWFEHNETITDVCDMIIYEPCNYASNIAYYFSVMEICNRKQNDMWPFHFDDEYVKALVQAFSMLGMGSSFMHGTNTKLGGKQDGTSNNLVAYLQHQASLSSLPYNSILHDLSLEPRNMNGTDMAQSFTDMYINEDVNDWYNYTVSMGVPSIYFSYAAYFCTAMTIMFDDDIVDALVPLLAGIFNVDDKYETFITDYYLVALRNETMDLQLGYVDKARLFGNGMGTVAKLIYAFLWQEHVLDISGDFFLGPIVNQLGWNFLPEFNQRMGQFQTYQYSMPEFQRGEDIYPGDDPRCNPVIPHAKWHLESAIGILDATHLADDMHRVLKTLQ